MSYDEGRVDEESELCPKPLHREAERSKDRSGEVVHWNKLSYWLDCIERALIVVEEKNKSLKKLGRQNCEPNSLRLETKVENEGLSPRNQQHQNQPQVYIKSVPMQRVVKEGGLEISSSVAPSQRGEEQHGSKHLKSNWFFLLKLIIMQMEDWFYFRSSELLGFSCHFNEKLILIISQIYLISKYILNKKLNKRAVPFCTLFGLEPNLSKYLRISTF